MLWLTWRQHRWQLIGVAALLTAYCGYLVQAGVRAHRALERCSPIGEAACLDTWNAAFTILAATNEVVLIGNLFPLAAGLFWGAPLLSRELEQGTYRLIFTQSVTRDRWLAAKLGVLAGVAALLGGITGAVVTWTRTGYAPMIDTRPFGDDVAFTQAGAVPMATWVFALLCGVTLGLLLRRTTMAMAATLVALPLVFAGLMFVRPHYLPPVDRLVGGAGMVADPSIDNGPRGWLFRVSYVDRAGRELDSAGAGAVCADPANTFPTATCLDRKGLRQRIVYQPAGRYPWFQGIEIGVLLTASGAMALFVRRRITHHLG